MKASAILILIVLTSTSALAQKTEYFKDSGFWKDCSEKKVSFKRETSKTNDTVVVRSYRMDDNLLLEERKFINDSPVGKWKSFDLNGQLIYAEDFTKLVYKQDGDVTHFADSEFDCDGCSYALFPDGSEGLSNYLKMNLNYPNIAKDANITGIVLVEFMIDDDGNATPFQVVKSAHPYLDIECWKLIESMPKWSPAMREGKAVNSYAALPFRFSLK